MYNVVMAVLGVLVNAVVIVPLFMSGAADAPRSKKSDTYRWGR